MLKLLEIENVAVIEKASVAFAKGLNVLTGETGAGKSIVIDSINAVTGQKTSRELVRAGAAHAFVSALFEDVDGRVTERLAACGVPAEADGTVLLQRTLYKDGKNLCRVNGVTVTVSMLKSVGEELINIHGQRDSQALLDAARHIDFLDSFAGLGPAVAAYAADYARLRETQKAIRSLQTDEAEKARRIDLLTWQINELTEAAVTVGEREELHRKKNILTNSLRLASALTAAVNALSGDGESAGAAQLLAQAAREITSVASVAKGLDAVASSLEEAENTAADAAAVIEDVLGQLDNVEGSLDAIEERLDKLYRLSKKYGETEEEMLAFLDSASKELELITLSDERLAELSAQREALLASCEKQAAALTSARKKSAKQLSAAVEGELAFLNMPSCRFVAEIVPASVGEVDEVLVDRLRDRLPGGVALPVPHERVHLAHFPLLPFEKSFLPGFLFWDLSAKHSFNCLSPSRMESLSNCWEGLRPSKPLNHTMGVSKSPSYIAATSWDAIRSVAPSILSPVSQASMNP